MRTLLQVKNATGVANSKKWMLQEKIPPRIGCSYGRMYQ